MTRALLGEKKCHLARHPCGHGWLVSLQLQCQVLSFLLYSSQSMLKQVVQAREHWNRDAWGRATWAIWRLEKGDVSLPGQTETLRLKPISVQTAMETQLMLSVKACLCWVWKMDGWMSCWLKSPISRQMQWENTHTQKNWWTFCVHLHTKCVALKWEIFLSILKNPTACGVNYSLTCFLWAEWGNKNLQMATKFASFTSMNVRR